MSAITVSSWWASNAGLPRHSRAPISIDDPQPGYYRTRVRKSAPWVAARIWRDDQGLHCRIGDREADPLARWPFLEPISISDWRQLEALRNSDHRFAAYDQPYDTTEGEMKP